MCSKLQKSILVLGSPTTLDTFDGEPGTVACRCRPDQKVFGRAVTHGRVRTPGALKVLAKPPLRTPVLIAS